jgi:hypothetical protein
MSESQNISSFSLAVSDPESTDPLVAFCTTGELHINLMTKVIVVVFYCWRNEAAFYAGKKPFNSVQVNLPTNPETSKLIDPLLATSQFGSTLIDYCLTHCEELKDAIYRLKV